MFDIRVLGAGKEVGRSAIHVGTGSEKFLLDYGIEVQDGNVPIQPKLDLTAVLLSHAHIDHSGLMPELYKRGYTGSVHALPVTFDLCDLLLHDSIKVQKKKGQIPHFMEHDIKRMFRMRKEVLYKEVMEFGSSSVEFREAGHIPGSASIIVENSGKRLLYTGDIKFAETSLMKGADDSMKDIDVIVSESTYAYGNHPDRTKLTDGLREIIQETYYQGGTTLLPSFAIGRTQELLTIVNDLGVPIVVDGMGIEATNSILRYPESVKEHRVLQRAFGKARKIGRRKERDVALERPSIIITTAGMLNGGPVGHYIKNLHDREDCALILTGYQVEGTVGRTLMDTGRYKNEGINVEVKNKFKHMDFSAHTDRNHLIKFYKKLNPEKIVLVHGEQGIDDFASKLREMGFDAVAPENGQKVKIN